MEVNLNVELLSITPNALDLIEEAGRICYNSKKGNQDKRNSFIKKRIEAGHESIIEHCCATFLIEGFSRISSQQLTRYRICSFSQRSQRFTKEDGFNYIIPVTIKDSKFINRFVKWMMDGKELYDEMINNGIPKEDARFCLPPGIETKLVMTMNFRELRHFLSQRLAKDAQWEIRNVAKEILRILKEQVNVIFDDLGDNNDKNKNSRNKEE